MTIHLPAELHRRNPFKNCVLFEWDGMGWDAYWTTQWMTGGRGKQFIFMELHRYLCNKK